MKRIVYREWRIAPERYWGLLAILAAVIGSAAIAALYMEHQGHWVTGMTNSVVWGTPHVFAVFLIVAASGALNVASIGSSSIRPPTSRWGVCPGCWHRRCWSAGSWCWCSTSAVRIGWWWP
jgi:hypothetical protein